MIREKDILQEIEFLEDSLVKTASELEKLRKMVPDGARLRAVRSGNGFHYFMRTRESGINGIYINENERQKAEAIAQIEYDEKLMIKLQDVLDNLIKWKRTREDDPFESTLEHMVPGKRALIRVSHKTDESFISDWANQDYTRLEFREGLPDYYTRKGLRVRSKSEVIIADILDEMSVPFLYEKPLYLGTGTVHPDFTLLNIKERREVYWEHFGMMDDMDYRNNAFLKIRKYESSGLYQYESVIWTFETGMHPLNTKDQKNDQQTEEKNGIWYIGCQA